MLRIDKSRRVLLLFCITFTISLSAFAESNEQFNWLSFLTANMKIKKLQPDKTCPQNQIVGLQVNNVDKQINAQVDQVNWDFSCIQNENKNKNIQTETTVQQIPQLLNQLVDLPNLSFELNKINLTSDIFKAILSSHVSIQKTDSQLSVTFTNKAFEGQINLNLASKKLTANGNIHLDELPDYLHFDEQLTRFLNHDLLLSYESDLNQWQTGNFKASWQGHFSDFSEQADLLVEGRVEILKQQLTLSKFTVNAKQILMPISKEQDWQTNYIKINNSDAIVFHYGQKKVEKSALQIRVGSSYLLTKVVRGQSKRIRIDKQKLPALYALVNTSGTEKDLLVDWQLSTLNQKLFGKVLLTPEKITVAIQENNIEVKSLVEAGRPYFDPLTALTIETGSIQLKALVQYHLLKNTLMINSDLVSDDISGKHEEILFDGLTLDSHLHYLFDKQKNLSILEDKQQVKVANLFVGLPVQSIQIDGKFAGGDALIQHFKARLLGGRVDFDDFKIAAPSQTILNVAGISLAEIIKYSAYPEITSKGIIDAMLPLKLTEDGPVIKEGIIFARAPGGYIKVPENTVIKAMGRANPAFSLTMQILSNFQFDTMLGKLGYTSDGESDLKVEIKGLSPTVSGTQPVHFNYTHQENILQLLKSLRFNDELARDIKERY